MSDIIYYPQNIFVNDLVKSCYERTRGMMRASKDGFYCSIVGAEPIEHNCPCRGNLISVSDVVLSTSQKRYICTKGMKK